VLIMLARSECRPDTGARACANRTICDAPAGNGIPSLRDSARVRAVSRGVRFGIRGVSFAGLQCCAGLAARMATGLHSRGVQAVVTRRDAWGLASGAGRAGTGQRERGAPDTGDRFGIGMLRACHRSFRECGLTVLPPSLSGNSEYNRCPVDTQSLCALLPILWEWHGFAVTFGRDSV